MHQQPLQAPFLPNSSASAGHKSGVSGRIVSFMPPPSMNTEKRGRIRVSYAMPPLSVSPCRLEGVAEAKLELEGRLARSDLPKRPGVPSLGCGQIRGGPQIEDVEQVHGCDQVLVNELVKIVPER